MNFHFFQKAQGELWSKAYKILVKKFLILVDFEALYTPCTLHIKIVMWQEVVARALQSSDVGKG